MAYVATNYLTNTKAPLGKSVCTRTSALGPYGDPPPTTTTGNPNYCGQCVSFVTTVCPTIPVNTRLWRKRAREGSSRNFTRRRHRDLWRRRKLFRTRSDLRNGGYSWSPGRELQVHFSDAMNGPCRYAAPGDIWPCPNAGAGRIFASVDKAGARREGVEARVARAIAARWRCCH